MKRINAKRHSAAEKYAECCVPTAISQQMKPRLHKVTTVMLATTLIILFFATNSCDKLRNFDFDGLSSEYHDTIPFTEYSLGDYCQWTNLNHGNDTVIIINSDTMLENYIACMGGTYPAIDFNQNSLLLIYGNSNSHVFSAIAKSFNITHIIPSKFELNIDVYLDDSPTTSQQWFVAVIVPKLLQNADITLNLGKKTCSDTVSYTNFPLNPSYFTNYFQYNTLYVFNSDTDLTTVFGYVPFYVDFSQYTLLCVRAFTAELAIAIQRFVLLENHCTDEHILKVDFWGNLPMVGTEWNISILVPKINNTILYYYNGRIQN